MTSPAYFRALWRTLAGELADRVCVRLTMAHARDERYGGETCTSRDWRREAELLAIRRERAMARADEALARYSMLRCDGGAR